MNKLFIIIIFFNFFSGFSQTKTETEKWIIEKYNDYESPVNNTRELIFDDGFLYYLWIFSENYGHWTQLPIKNIKQIKIHHQKYNSEDKEGWDVITLYFDKNKSKTKDAKPSVDNTYKVFESTSIDIKLTNKFIEDGLKPRMEKAFLHLIKSHGGNATIKKETF